MELSILIPVYNFHTLPLVEALHSQLVQSQLNYEIIVIDDGSNEYFISQNRPIQNIPNVKWIELSQNIGRSKIRNLLVEHSKFENLLFLDGDNEIIHSNYIQIYEKYLCKEFDVIVGGTSYAKSKPINPEFILHWKVGKNREEKSANFRNKNPFQSFILYNVIIKKKLYYQVPLDEKIITYGHEDTKFGLDLEKANINILHVDNPVRHIGLNTIEVFFHKTELAVKNLQMLQEIYHIGHQIKLYKYYLILKKLHFQFLYFIFFKTFKPLFIYNLKSTSPSLLIFDLYKLYILTKLNIR